MTLKTNIINFNTRKLITKDDKRHSSNIQTANILTEEKDTQQVRSSFSTREIRESMFDNMNVIRSNKSTSYRFRDNARILRMYVNADARNFDRNFERKVA